MNCVRATGCDACMMHRLNGNCTEKFAAVAVWYEKLLGILRTSAVGRGEGEVLRTREAWAGNPTAANLVAVQWRERELEFDLVVVNLAPHRSQCYAPLSVPNLSARVWRMEDRLGEERYVRAGEDLQSQGLYLDLPARGAQLFHFKPEL